MWYCNAIVISLIVSSDDPLLILSRMLLFVLIISLNLCVKSSSRRWPFSSIILGLTAGGGTGNTVQIIHSGLFHFGLNPINSISSSVSLLNILRTSSAVNSKRVLEASSDFSFVSFHSAIIFIGPSLLYFDGCLAPQPREPSSPQHLILVFVLQSLK